MSYTRGKQGVGEFGVEALSFVSFVWGLGDAPSIHLTARHVSMAVVSYIVDAETDGED